jgi:hypothetical protein
MVITILACATILSSLRADYVATSNLFAQYGPQYEANPIIRQVGPQTYFGALMVVTATTVCQAEKRGERWPMLLAVLTWGVQTWAVSTHEPYGTARVYPRIFFRIELSQK